MYTAVIDVAHARNDEGILRRIKGEDLIVLDIFYHKTCYATFTSKKHIQRAVASKTAYEFDPYKVSFGLDLQLQNSVTVYILLKYAQNVAVKTGQLDIVVTFDLAICSKAQETIWSTN